MHGGFARGWFGLKLAGFFLGLDIAHVFRILGSRLYAFQLIHQYAQHNCSAGTLQNRTFFYLLLSGQFPRIPSRFVRVSAGAVYAVAIGITRRARASMVLALLPWALNPTIADRLAFAHSPHTAHVM
jgi:hypothetical protein